MANRKQNITVAQAFDVLNYLVEHATDETLTDAMADAGLTYEAATPDNFRGKFNKMNANAHKTTTPRKSQPSKASIMNANDAHTFADVWPHEKPFTLKDVGNEFPTRLTTSSRVSVVNVLMREKAIEHTEKVNGHTAYKFVA